MRWALGITLVAAVIADLFSQHHVPILGAQGAGRIELVSQIDLPRYSSLVVPASARWSAAVAWSRE